MSQLSLIELLTQLRQDIVESQTALVDANTQVGFLLETVEIEAKFTVAAEGQAGIKFYVVTAGGKVGSEEVHSIRLTVKPTEELVAIASGQNRPAP